jgi:hypothetical protein
MRWRLGALWGTTLAGCSFLYSPNNLPEVPSDAGPDALPDAAIVLDANPSLLELIDIVPAVIEEGQGDLGSPPALLVIRGHQIVNANLKVSLAPPGGTIVKLEPISDAIASHNGDFLAFSVISRVDPAPTGDVQLEVTVSEDVPAQYGGGVVTRTLAKKVTLRGLPELTSGSQLTTPLAPKYSTVNLSNAVTFVGAVPAEVRAVTSIRFGAIVASATSTTPGPGGHAGGMTVGGGAGGGGVGTGAAVLGLGGGGGGAGFATDGGQGATAQGAGGSAGSSNGDDLLISLAGNRPSAGGAGGPGLLASTGPGGPGGAGGGIVVLSAGGNITTGTITVIGGSGGAGVVVAGLGGGGGGGGAGGAVLLATDAGRLTTGAINIAGGGRGAPGGGLGSVGRVRWDAPDGTAPSVPLRAPHRGPSFAMSERVFTIPNPSLTVVGTSNDRFRVRVIDHDNEVHVSDDASFNSEGMATINPLLRPGRNQVCITLDGGAQGAPEADKCIDVAFLP